MQCRKHARWTIDLKRSAEDGPGTSVLNMGEAYFQIVQQWANVELPTKIEAC